MSTASRRRTGGTGVVVRYHPSHLPGMICCTVVDDGPPRARVHDRFVLFTLTAGEALVRCRGETHTPTPGSMLMLEPGDVHRDLEKTPYSAVMVVLRPDLVKALRGLEHGQRLGSPFVRCAALCTEALALVDAVRNGHELATQERQTLRVFALLEPFWTRSGRHPEPPLVARARRALAESPSENLSLEALATRLRCTPTYLCRVFSRHTGVGPRTYQLQQRLLEAGRLIESGRSVSAAAVLTGFGDASHLRRHFLRRFAVAPGQYQKALSTL